MYKLILPANKIPIGSIVTKFRGQKEYRILDRLSIHHENDTIPTIINANIDHVFLIPIDVTCHTNTANIQSIKFTTELIWKVERVNLTSYLNIE